MFELDCLEFRRNEKRWKRWKKMKKMKKDETAWSSKNTLSHEERKLSSRAWIIESVNKTAVRFITCGYRSLLVSPTDFKKMKKIWKKMKKYENSILWGIYEKMKYPEATLNIDQWHCVTPGMPLWYLGYKIYDTDSPKSLLPAYLMWVAFVKQWVDSKKMKKDENMKILIFYYYHYDALRFNKS